MRAPAAHVAAAHTRSDQTRHMDVYPSRNADIREHRMPALHHQLIACGHRQRLAGAFPD